MSSGREERATLHDDGGNIDVGLDALVGQDAATVNVDLVANGDIVTQDSDVLETGPLADAAVPADNGALDPGVVLDLGTGQQGASLQTNTVTNDNVLSDDDVGANAAVLANLGAGVDENVAAVDEGLRVGGQKLGGLLGQRGQIQAGTGEVILGLTHVHPEAVQVKGVQLAILDNGREGLLLDRGRAVLLNAVQDGSVENVQTGVDAVANELDGLLNEAVNPRRVVGLVDNDTVLGGLLDLGHDNGALVAVGLVELGEGLEGILACDVGVEDEEGGVVLGEDVLGQLQGAGGAEGLALDRDDNVDIVLLGELWTHIISNGT